MLQSPHSRRENALRGNSGVRRGVNTKNGHTAGKSRRLPSTKRRRPAVFVLCLPAFLLLIPNAAAQESLQRIVDRGYVADWVIGGPLPANADGGIEESLRQHRLPMAETGPLEEATGPIGERPLPGTRTPLPRGGELAWYAYRAQGPLVNLGGLFLDREQGIAYAAFACNTPNAATVYFDLQTPLGARLWVNGEQRSDVRTGAPAYLGVDRLLVRLPAGISHVVIATPLLGLEGQARLWDLPPETLQARGFDNRPLLSGEAPHGFALRVRAVRALGSAAYVPRLENRGYFADTPTGPVQTAALTLFNPASTNSLPIRVTIMRADGQGDPIKQLVAPIPPGMQHEALLEVPLAGAEPGDSVAMSVNLRTRSEQIDFTAPLKIGNPPPRGTIYLSTSGLFTPAPPTDPHEAFEAGLAELDRQVQLAQADEDYGFPLGPMPLWRAYLATRPGARSLFAKWVQQGRCAPFADYGRVDERLAPPEVVLRSMVMAQRAAERYFGQATRTAVLWNARGLSPQFAQMAGHADLEGAVTNLPAAGLAALGRLAALNGQTLSLRRKKPAPGAGSLDLLRERARLQRIELAEKGIPFDLLLHDPPGLAPPAYLLGMGRPLLVEIPSIELTGNAPARFFEDLQDHAAQTGLRLPMTGRCLNADRPGELLVAPELKRAYAQTAGLVDLAERYAALARLSQAELPLDPLDTAFEQLVWTADPDRLASPATPEVFCDAMAALREGASFAGQILERSVDGLAQLIDTAQATPIEPPGIEPFIVFNPMPWTRTAYCQAGLPSDLAGSVTLRDDNGMDLPFAAVSIPSQTGALKPGIEFLAEDIPAMGHRTYLLVPGGTPPQPANQGTPVLETDLYRIQFDPRQGGCIVSLLHKPSGTEYAARLMNDLTAYEIDPASDDGGREIHSTGRFARTSESAAQVEVQRSPVRQTAVVTADFAGGHVVRRVSIYEGQPRIDCEVEIAPGTARGALLGVYFALHRVGALPIYGERYGSVTGRTGPAGPAFATGPGRPWGAPGLHPAYRWAAVAPGPAIALGTDGEAPLGPVQIVHGENRVLAEGAEVLMAALLERGIPVQIWEETNPGHTPAWTDATVLPDQDADFAASAAVRICLGSGAETQLTKRLAAAAGEDAARLFDQGLSAGTRAFVMDTGAPGLASPVPTLLLAGATPDVTLTAVLETAAELRSTDRIAVPPGGHWSGERWPAARPAMALLFAGTALFRATDDGGLFMALAQPGGGQAGHMLDLESTPAGRWRYALYPFLGAWDRADLPRSAAAFNAPLIAHNTQSHQGVLAPRRPMLDIPAGFLISALKPLGYPSADGDRRSALGFALRGYEYAGRPWHAQATLPLPIARSALRNALESQGSARAVQGNTAPLAADPFEIRTWTFQPAQPLAPQAPDLPPLRTPSDAVPVRHSRYWEHRRGAMPPGGLPVSVLLEGDLSGPTMHAKAVVINNRTTENIGGAVRLYAAPGWAVTPEHFSYRLEPGEAVERELTVLSNGAPGGLFAESEYGGAVYRDVLEADPSRLRIEGAEEGATYRVRVHNESPLPARGLVEVIAPPEFWPELTGGSGLVPRAIALDIPPGGVQEAVFLNRGTSDPPWVTAKAAANGHTAYARMQPVWPALPIEEGFEEGPSPAQDDRRTPQVQPSQAPRPAPPLGRIPQTAPPPNNLAPLN